jgi:hypothetical protein
MDPKQYDVFISYRRTESKEWVRSSLFEQLQLCTTRDGARPEIFFDMSEIQPGQQYLTVLADGILNSRRFVPVYTPDYFDSEFCNWEISRAFELDPMGRRQLIIPLLLKDEAESKIAFSYRGIQFLRVSDADWFERLCRNLELNPPAAEPAARAVRVWVETASLPTVRTRKIQLIPRTGQGAQFRLGDRVRIGFQSSFDAYVSLIDVATDGGREVIWPNAPGQDNFCRREVTYYVPAERDAFDFRLEGDPGTETVLAVACPTKEETARVPELLQSGALDELLAPRTRKIAVVPREQGAGRESWTTASCGFTINA